MLVGRIFFGYVTFCFLGRDQEAARQAQLSLESLMLAWVPVVMFLLFSFPNPHIIFQSPEAMLQLGSEFNGNSFITLSLSLYFIFYKIFLWMWTIFLFLFLPFLKSLLNLWQHCFCFVFWFFGHKAYRILAPWPGVEPTPPALKGKVLTTGPPGKSCLSLSLEWLVQQCFPFLCWPYWVSARHT